MKAKKSKKELDEFSAAVGRALRRAAKVARKAALTAHPCTTGAMARLSPRGRSKAFPGSRSRKPEAGSRKPVSDPSARFFLAGLSNSIAIAS